LSLWGKLFRSTASDHYEKGIGYFNDGNYDRAVEHLERVIAGEKSRGSAIAKLGAFYAAEAHAKLGLAEFHRGHYEKALEHFDSALGVNPHYPDLYYYTGVVYHKRQDGERATENLRRAVELNPEYAEAVCYLGIVLHEAGFHEQAGDCFSRARELTQKTPNPLSPILLDKLQTRNFEHPILQDIQKAADDTTHFRELVNDGNTAFNQAEYERAIACFEEAVKIRDNYADLNCRLGLAYFEHGDTRRAVGMFEKALDRNPNTWRRCTVSEWPATTSWNIRRAAPVSRRRWPSSPNIRIFTASSGPRTWRSANTSRRASVSKRPSLCHRTTPGRIT
jgi:tetratricopeptide (TPR) repeat protein